MKTFFEHIPQIKILTLEDLEASNNEIKDDLGDNDKDFVPETFEDFVNREMRELYDRGNKNISVEFRTNSSTNFITTTNTIKVSYVSIAIIHYSFPFKAAD